MRNSRRQSEMRILCSGVVTSRLMSVRVRDMGAMPGMRAVALCLLVGGIACGHEPSGTGPASLRIVSEELKPGMVGTAYTDTLRADGGSGTYAWQATIVDGLPAGLELVQGGVISGVPEQWGSYTVSVEVVSGPDRATRALSLIIQNLPLSITSDSFPAALVGVYYREQLRWAGGVSPSARTFWSVRDGQLPPGLSITGGWTGFPAYLEGSPMATGQYSFVLFVHRGTVGPIDSTAKAYTLTVKAQGQGNKRE
jgi:hypothetical protein